MGLMNTLFGPLNSVKYCYIYYLLEIGFFAMFLFALVYFIYSRFTKTPQPIMSALTICISYLYMYFMNRLIYTICSNSFK